MDLIALQLFCDIVETQSMTRAAERNGVSQSAVSQRIRILENDLGQILIERSKGKGKVFVTDAGRILYNGAKPLLNGAAELDARMRGLSDDVSGVVRVATVYSVGLHILPERMKPFLKTHPRVNIQLEYSMTSKVYNDVLSSAADVGIVACPSAKGGVDIVPFSNEEMVFICAPEHPLASKSSIRLKDISPYPFVAFSDDIPTRTLIDSKLWAAGARVEIVNAYDNIEIIKNLVEIGSGVSIVPKSSIIQSVRDGLLKEIAIVPRERFYRPTGLILKRNRARRAAVIEFVEAMTEQQKK